MTQIRTARLSLRPVRIDDGPALLALIANWQVVRWLARVPWPYTAADMDAYLAVATRTAESPSPSLVILLDGAPIGQIGCDGQAVIDDEASDGDVGFWLGEPYWGRGYMSEALVALVAHVFARRPEVAVLRSGWFEGNDASARVHEKAGFEVTGRVMRHCLAQGQDLPLIAARLTRARHEAWRP